MRSMLALVLVPSLAAADVDEKGLRAGTVYTGADGDGIKPSPGITGGAFVVERFAPNFGLQIEGLLERQAFDLRLSDGPTQASFQLYALELPVLARLDVAPERFYLAAGIGPVVSLGGVDTISDKRVDEIKGFNLALQVGIGLEIPVGPGRITIDARYRHLLFDLSDTGNFINEPNGVKQSHMILACVGYGFP